MRTTLWCLLGCCFLATCFPARLAAQPLVLSSRLTPSVRLGDEHVPYSASTVDIPVLVKNDQAVDGLHLEIDYDPEYLVYGWYSDRSDTKAWTVTRFSFYGARRIILELRKLSERPDLPAAVDSPQPAEERVLSIVFFLSKRSAEGQPFLVKSTLSPGTEVTGNDPSGSYFYTSGAGEGGEAAAAEGQREAPGDNNRPVHTRLKAGSVTIYFQDGVEVGWGRITETVKEFTLPLYLTYFREDRRTIAAGVDYDEMFLRFVDIVPVSPPLEEGKIDRAVDELKGDVTFKLEMAPGFLPPVAHRHVADLVFEYLGGATPGQDIVVQPRLIDENGAPDEAGGPDADGGGASYGGHASGGVRLMAPYFVRGNADSSSTPGPGGSPSVLPTVSDAGLILRSVFNGDVEIPCRDAADTDNNGRLDVTDAIRLLNHIFRGGPPPPMPYPEPGVDGEGEDGLDCQSPLSIFES